jgi:glutathione synthase
MTIKLGVVMDAFSQLKIKKDSTLAILEAAQSRGYELYCFEIKDLFLRDGQAYGSATQIRLQLQASPFYEILTQTTLKLNELSCLLIRKDPPFDAEYLYSTYILEHAEREGLLVVNRPASLRDANEKLYTAWFASYCPPTLATSKINLLRDFLNEVKEVILKPVDQMGGRGIFRVNLHDPNISVILETITQYETQMVIAQKYLPEISQGDKRVLLVGGQPIPYALARIPQPGETRGNMAAGGRTEGRELTPRDKELCAIVGPTLYAKGLWLVGLDIIGDYITEINVTSPTGIRELDLYFNLSIANQYLDFLEKKIPS